MTEADIQSLIDREAPSDTEHDAAYREALRLSYETYKDMELAELLQWQRVVRAMPIMTHSKVAACMVLHRLIGERRA